MKILILNTGSSSFKFKLLDVDNKETLLSGLVERIGEETSFSKAEIEKTGEKLTDDRRIANHSVGVALMKEFIEQSKVLNSLDEISAIGHRVVQGGEKFAKPALITPELLDEVKKLVPLAPLHNPANIQGIEEMQKNFPGIPNVAVFDTSFHQTMPKHAFMYALPYEFYEKFGIRRYGFHGTSHAYVSKQAAKLLNLPFENFSGISLHIGSGASVCAVENGKSIDTSMGFTPLEGLIMGTRTGDMDPAIYGYLERELNVNSTEIDNILNKKSGILGIFGKNDMRDVEGSMDTDEKAKLAYDMFIYRIVKYVGSYWAAIKNNQAIIFTAGVGENSNFVRRDVCAALAHFGVEIDASINDVRSKEPRIISTANSKIKVLVIPTDEEQEIADEVVKIISQK